MSEEIEKKWRGLMETWMEIEYRQVVEYLDGKVRAGRLDEESSAKWKKSYLEMIGKDEEWGEKVWEGKTIT